MSYMTLPELVAELVTETVAIEVKAKVAKEAGIVAGIADAKTRVAVDTGATRDSIGPDGEDGYGAGTDYAGWLEFGTSDTAPQPFIGPSSDKAEQVFVTALTATVGP
jgi:HK97 gp10 family phage protein